MTTYELRVFKRDRELRHGAEAIQVPLDLTDGDGTRDLLERHLIAAAERDGSRRNEVHLYHFEVRAVYRDGRIERTPAFKFSMPVEENR